MILAKHLDCEKALKYINTYETKNTEHQRKFESILHKKYQNGNMSLKSLQPVSTEKRWIDRNKDEITDLRVELQAHLLKRKEKELNFLFAFFVFCIVVYTNCCLLCVEILV